MSDAATDTMVEEDLRRCRGEGHRLFFFRVGGAEVAVCARCQVRFIEDVTAGDGSEWDQQVREAREQEEVQLDDAMARHPAGSASGTIKCCKPLMLAKPSGRKLCHSRFCSEHPGEPIDLNVYVGSQPVGSEPWRGRRLRG